MTEAMFPYFFWGLFFIGCALSVFVMRCEYLEELEDSHPIVSQHQRDIEFTAYINRRD